MTKFFFMAQLRATLNGQPRFEFNSVTALGQRNVFAADLIRIQEAGAQMVAARGVEFDDIVIQSLIFLAEGTEEQFFANTQMPQSVTIQHDDAAPEALEEAVAASIEQGEQPSPEAEAEAPVEEVATADLPVEAAPAEEAPAEEAKPDA